MSEKAHRPDIASPVSTSPSSGVRLESDLPSTSPPPSSSRRTHSASDWIDVQDLPPARTSTKRTSSKKSKDRHHTPPDSDVSRFFPRLTRILETNESTLNSKSSPRASSQRRPHTSSSQKRSSVREEKYHRPVKHKVGGVHRRSQPPYPRSNSSMLSVVSGVTGVSERSSGSNSTITQRSYSRQESRSTAGSSPEHLQTPNVFDFMMPPSEHDVRSTRSSSTSSARSHSSYDSSDGPGTPSSRSTIPSPVEGRKGSALEFRRRYDTSHVMSTRGQSISPDPTQARTQSLVTDIPEAANEDDEMEDPDVEQQSAEQTHYSLDVPRQTPHHPQPRPSDQWRKQDELRRQHMTYATHAQNRHYMDSSYGMRRSESGSSTDSDPYAHYTALQQYQYRQENFPANANVASTARPAAPDAPDLSRRTVAGYELIASELSNDSNVKPLYRKFEYLNHRILLHLQDELCEMEEQLRVADEVIAQMDAIVMTDDSTRIPASRRSDAYKNSEVHARRTDLLGRIFMKTEQYNRAMASYAALSQESENADEEDIYAYRKWMVKHAPIHEVETRFLQKGADLFLPAGRKMKQQMVEETSPPAATEHPSSTVYLLLALSFPLLLYAVIPSFGGRLFVSIFVAGAAYFVATTTELGNMLPKREWAICGAAYVVVMAVVAGCIPTAAATVPAGVPNLPSVAARHTVKR